MAAGPSQDARTLDGKPFSSRYRNGHASTAMGSVKSMIGHTKTVAGLAGMIKTALALKHGVLPTTIGVDKPTTRFDFSAGPFYLNTETRPWICEEASRPRRADVSAFGFGGTNFRTILRLPLLSALPPHPTRDWPPQS